MILDKSVKDLLYKNEYYYKAIYMGEVIWEKELDGWIDIFHDKTLNVRRYGIQPEDFGNGYGWGFGVYHAGDDPILAGNIYIKFNNKVLQEHNKKLALTENLLNIDDMTHTNGADGATPFGIKVIDQQDGAEYGFRTLDGGFLKTSYNTQATKVKWQEDGDMVKAELPIGELWDVFLGVPEPFALKVLTGDESSVQEVQEKHQAYMDDLVKRLDIRVKVEP